jgi:hypothetical protein
MSTITTQSPPIVVATRWADDEDDDFDMDTWSAQHGLISAPTIDELGPLSLSKTTDAVDEFMYAVDHYNYHHHHHQEASTDLTQPTMEASMPDADAEAVFKQPYMAWQHRQCTKAARSRDGGGEGRRLEFREERVRRAQLQGQGQGQGKGMWRFEAFKPLRGSPLRCVVGCDDLVEAQCQDQEGGGDGDGSCKEKEKSEEDIGVVEKICVREERGSEDPDQGCEVEDEDEVMLDVEIEVEEAEEPWMRFDDMSMVG